MSKKSRILFIAFLFCLCKTPICNAQDGIYIDSLKAVLKTAKSDTGHIQLLNKISYAYVFIDSSKSIKYAQEALELSKKIGYKKGEIHAITHWGEALWMNGNIDEGIRMNLQALDMSRASGDSVYVAYLYSNLGVMYESPVDDERATQYFLKSIKLAESTGDKSSLSYAYLNYSWILFTQGDRMADTHLLLKALDYISKSLDNARQSNEKIAYMNATINIGLTYIKLAKYNPQNKTYHTKALPFLNAGLTYAKAMNDFFHICFANECLGDWYSLQNDNATAQNHYEKALQYARKGGFTTDVSAILPKIGNIYILQHQNDKAMQCFAEGLYLARSLKDKEAIASNADGFSKLYEQLGNYRKAFEYSRMYTTVKDSLTNERNVRAVNQIRSAFELENKDQQINVLSKDRELQDAKIERQKTLRNGLIIGLILVVTFTLLILKRYEVSNNQKRIIAEANNQLELQKIIIEDKNDELVRSNKELEQFAYVASHDLKAPLRGISTVTQWLQSDHAQMLNQEGKNLLNDLENRTNRMNALVEDILEYARIGRNNSVIEFVNLNVLIDEVLSSLSIPQNFTINVFPNMPTIKAQKAPLFQLFSNLISNAIKYNDKENGIITISHNIKDGHTLFSVSDNGRGIDKKYHEKVFNIFETLGVRETTDSTGIGLAIVKKVVEHHNGKIWVNSKPGEGANFIFYLEEV